MKKLSFVLMLSILLAGGVIGAMCGPSYAQGDYDYPPPPQDPNATPWVGNNTPWTFYQGDWFLNGILYNFFGNQYGWAPYYSYPYTYMVRPGNWYEPRWNSWYQGHPQYWNNFERQYPYWRGHQAGQHYGQDFYNQHHRGQGGGWNQGFHGVRPPGTTGPRVQGGRGGKGDRGDRSQGGRGGYSGRSGNLTRAGSGGGGGRSSHGSNLARGGAGGRSGGGGGSHGGGGGHGRH